MIFKEFAGKLDIASYNKTVEEFNMKGIRHEEQKRSLLVWQWEKI